MLTRNEYAVRPEIQRLVEEILLENSRYKRELRSFHREELVCPVTVIMESSNLDDQHCVSRNISPAGICLISSVKFDERVKAAMDIYRLKKPLPFKLSLNVDGAKPFGDLYWMSGWQFMSLQYKTINRLPFKLLPI